MSSLMVIYGLLLAVLVGVVVGLWILWSVVEVLLRVEKLLAITERNAVVTDSRGDRLFTAVGEVGRQAKVAAQIAVATGTEVLKAVEKVDSVRSTLPIPVPIPVTLVEPPRMPGDPERRDPNRPDPARAGEGHEGYG